LFELITDSVVFTWIILPLIIFLCRIIDVTIGTARVIFVSRGYRVLAASAGFFEVLIWLMAIGQIMQPDQSVVLYAYASGFALGNYIGITLTEKLSLGIVLIRVIVNQNSAMLVESLKMKDYGVTCLEGTGAYGAVNIVFTIVPRRQVEQVIQIIKTFNPQAFYSIEEIGRVSENKLAVPGTMKTLGSNVLIRPFRKGK
jgi:uncharacterized protein YebE (UPF0316 family)